MDNLLWHKYHLKCHLFVVLTHLYRLRTNSHLAEQQRSIMSLFIHVYIFSILKH